MLAWEESVGKEFPSPFSLLGDMISIALLIVLGDTDLLLQLQIIFKIILPLPFASSLMPFPLPLPEKQCTPFFQLIIRAFNPPDKMNNDLTLRLVSHQDLSNQTVVQLVGSCTIPNDSQSDKLQISSPSNIGVKRHRQSFPGKATVN